MQQQINGQAVQSELLSLDGLKTLFGDIKNCFEKNLEQESCVNEFNKQLTNLMRPDVEKNILTVESSKFIFEELIPGFAKRILAHKTNNLKYALLIADSINLLTTFFDFCIKQDSIYKDRLNDISDAMRSVFDTQQKFYQSHFQHELGGDAGKQDVKNNLQNYSEEERLWRQNLQKGTILDAFKNDLNFKISYWSKGIVEDAVKDTKGNTTTIRVSFVNDITVQALNISIDSELIAPLGSKAEDEEWRSQLKRGDEVDAMDNCQTWYLSTVIIPEERVNPKFPNIKIGFRQYASNGDKTDEMGRYFGFSDKVDEHIGSYTARIQKKYTRCNGPSAKTTLQSEIQPLVKQNSDQDRIDLQMLENPDQIIFATERNTCKSSMLVQLINKFGQQDGFNSILNCLQRESTGLDSVFYIVDMISKVQEILHKSFIDQFYERLRQIVEQKILGASQIQLRQMKRERIEELTSTLWDKILARVNTNFETQVQKNILNLNIGVQLLRLNFMEKRIDGAKFIDNICKQLMNSSTKSLEKPKLDLTQMLISMLREKNVFQEFFSKSKCHAQLVQRSQGLLKLLISQEAITEEELNLIWDTCKSDESIKIDLYKVLQDIALSMGQRITGFFIKKITNQKITQIKVQELELLESLASENSKKEDSADNLALILDFFWHYLFDQEQQNNDRQQTLKATSVFSDILKNVHKDVQNFYIEKLSNNLQSATQGFITVKIISRFVDSFVERPAAASDLEGVPYTKLMFVNHAEQNFNLLENIFHDLNEYMVFVQSQICELTPLQIEQLGEQVIFDRFPHQEQVKERVQLIGNYVAAGSFGLQLSHLERLWDLIIRENLIVSDHPILYKWLRILCDAVLKEKVPLINQDDLIRFFTEKTNGQHSDFVNLSLEGYFCFQTFFILINRKAHRLVLLGEEGKQAPKMTSYNNQTGAQFKSYSFKPSSTTEQDPETVEVMVKAEPNQMEGIQGLFKIAIDCLDKKVGECVTNLLLQLHTNVDFGMEHLIPLFEDQFIHTCLVLVNQQYEQIQTRQEVEIKQIEARIAAIEGYKSRDKVFKYLPVQEKRIIKCLTYIQMLIQNSEKDGLHNLRPHLTLNQGELLSKIQISNSLKTGEGYRAKFEISTYSNTTVYELKKIIGYQLSLKQLQDGTWIKEPDVHPQSIKLNRFSTGNSIKDTLNGCTLAELKFKPNESITVTSRAQNSVSKVPLVNEDGTDINARAYFIFSQLFDMYAVEDPDDPTSKIMRLQEICNFIKGATKETCRQDDNRVLFIAGFDSNNDGKLDKNDFIQFYRKSCFEKVDVVRTNLTNYNYNHSLKQIPKSGDDDNILQPRKTILEMPRYKIANDVGAFNTLFKLFSLHHEVQIETKTLIQMLCTNQNYFWHTIWLDQRPPSYGQFAWSDIFNTADLNKLQYALEIINSFVQSDPSVFSTESDEYKLRYSWVKRFLVLGGFAQLVKLLPTVIDKQDDMNDLRLNLLDQLLKLIKVFVTGAIKADQTEETQQNAQSQPEKQVDTQTRNEQELAQEEKKYQSPEKQVQIPFVVNPAEQDPNFIGPLRPNHSFDGTAQSVTQDMLFGEKSAQEQQVSNKEEQKSEVSVVVENEFENSDRFRQIIREIKELNLQQYILSAIDFAQLQNDILSIVSKLTQRVIIFKPEENAIVISGLALWTQTVLQRPQLFQGFLEWQSDGMNASDFIRNGIYSGKALAVRVAYKLAFEKLSKNYPTNDNQLQPLNFILEVLFQNQPEQGTDEVKSRQTKDCNEFFQLFIELVKHTRKQNRKQSQNFELKHLLIEAINKMKTHQSNEKPTTIFEDKVLVGYISLVRELLLAFIEETDYEEIIAFEQEQKLLHEMFYENLYYVPGKTLNPNQNKCKVTTSRTIAYKLLYRYLKALKPKELVEFLENDLAPMVKELPTPKKWSHQPSDKTRYQYSGIINLGCICYMISMLQQFFMVPQFRYLLLRAEDNKQPEIKEWRGRNIDDNLLVQFQRIFGFLESTERQAHDITDFVFAFKDHSGNPTNPAIQQDSQEFLNVFFDRLENQLEPTSQKYLVQDVFRGSNVTQLTCRTCGNTQSRLQYFYNLSVEVKNKQNLYQSLDKLIEPAEIQDYFCEKCQLRVDIDQRTLIGETPNVLFVHLQRIVFSFDTFQNEKINTRFEFPNLLDLRQYSFKSVTQREGMDNQGDITEELKQLQQFDDDCFIYKLVGVNIHVGAADHGHYYSLINTNRGFAEIDPYVKESEWLNVEKDNWRVFNDEEVKFFSFKDLAGEAYGGNETALSQDEVQNFLSRTEQAYGKSAYMLVYERKRKKQVRQILTSEEVLIDYRNVTKYVPNWIQKQVTKDNIEFVVDRQVFHPQFFNLVKLILQHIGTDQVLTQHKYVYTYLHHFDRLKTIALDIGQRVMFDFLSRYSDKTSIAPICEALCNIVIFSESWITFCSQRGSNLISNFIKKYYLDDNCKTFFELMFICGDQTARQYIAKFTAKLINRGFQIWGVLQSGENKNHERVVELYNNLDSVMHLLLLKLHERDCQTNWSRLMNYFTLLMEIGMGGKHQTLYMLQNFDYVVDICDVMLGDKSPKAAHEKEKRISMGGSVSMTPFGPLVALASHLIRSSYTKEMMQHDDLDLQTFSLFANDEKTTDPKKKLDTRILISDEAYQYFTNPDLVNFIMQYNFQEEEYGRALTHLCFDNEKLSKKVCKFLLKSIVNSDYEKIKPFLVIVSQLLKIKDKEHKSLQRKRLEWILGFGFLRTVQTESKCRVGIEITFHNIKEEVYMMKSMLTYDPENESSLLHLLWRYQGRMDTYTINCLEDLALIIAGDDDIKQFFSELPGMTYQYARYSDWIKPYLETQIQNSLASTMQTAYYTNIRETAQRVQDYYKNYEEYIKKIDSQSGQANQEVLACTPKQYVILRQTQNETYVDSFYEKEGVSLSLSYVECQYVWSQPTGKNNLAIGPKFLSKYTVAAPAIDVKINVPNINKSALAMLKERDQQLSIDTGSTIPFPTKDRNNQQASDQDQQQSSQSTQIETLTSENSTTNKNDQKQETADLPNIDMQGSPYYQVNTGEDSDDSFKNWDGDQIFNCSDLIYKLTINNATNTPICYKIKLNEGQNGPPNLKWPRTGIKGTIDVGETSVVAILQKITPDVQDFKNGKSEIEKLNIILDWKIDERKMRIIASKNTAAQNSSALRTSNKPANGQVRFNDGQGGVTVTETTNTGSQSQKGEGLALKRQDAAIGPDQDAPYNPTDFGAEDDVGGYGAQKYCPGCTVLNPISATECYLCQTKFSN